MGMSIPANPAHDKVKLLQRCQKDACRTWAMGRQRDLFIPQMSPNFTAQMAQKIIPYRFLHSFWLTIPVVCSPLSPFICCQVKKVRSQPIQIGASCPVRELLLHLLVEGG